MSATDNQKRIMNVPCGREAVDERTGKTTMIFPGVNCQGRCETCDWNPQEHARRLKEGVWKPVYERRNEETGRRIVLEGVQQLRFKYSYR